MTTIFDIADVARLTGLSARALRFYEARGLVQPLRTASARRLYDAAALERLHQVVALKRAGLSLARIKHVLDRRAIDLRALIAALLKPFTEVATPQMWNGVATMYADMPKWEGEADPGFSSTVWHFIQNATNARRAAGGKIDGPA